MTDEDKKFYELLNRIKRLSQKQLKDLQLLLSYIE